MSKVMALQHLDTRPSYRYGKVGCGSLSGLESEVIEIEVSIMPGLPRFEVAGLAGNQRKDILHRVLSALKSADYRLPAGQVTANLRPSRAVRKSSVYDLPLLLALLQASSELNLPDKVAAFGELSLNGRILAVPGALIRAEQLLAAGYQWIVIPADNAGECRSCSGRVIPAANVRQAVDILANRKPTLQDNSIHTKGVTDEPGRLPGCIKEVSEISGLPAQEAAVRAVQAAAAGGHHIVMIGSAGCGKTKLAGFLGALLSEPSERERLEILRIYSVAGLLPGFVGDSFRRPIRSPHFTTGMAALCGGGHVPVPGELSLAHRGLLFLDELQEFSHRSLAALRQPLEEKQIHLLRHDVAVTFPTNFLLAGAANPCPCGLFLEQDETVQCTCKAHEIQGYRRKFQGPFADRIDLWVELRRVETAQLSDIHNRTKILTAEQMSKTISRARARQLERNEGVLNSQVGDADTPQVLQIGKKSLCTAMQYAELARLSIRSFHKLLRVARTLADLDNEEEVKIQHISEATQFRRGEYL